MYLNGDPAPVATIATTDQSSFRTWHTFLVTDRFAVGQNTLDFTVTNLGGPTALRMELTGTARCCCASANTSTAGGPDTICQSASPSPLTLSGASVGGGATSGAWSIIAGGGT